MIKKAREYAIEAHGSQKYGKLPYHVHLDEVAQIAAPYGETAQALAYLHDVIEDTDKNEQDIAKDFGKFFATCVSILSDEPGATRKIRKDATYKKMSLVQGKESIALLVKAADRLANMRACVRAKDQKLLSMYKAEYDTFKVSAYRENLCEEIWAKIDAIQNA